MLVMDGDESAGEAEMGEGGEKVMFSYLTHTKLSSLLCLSCGSSRRRLLLQSTKLVHNKIKTSIHERQLQIKDRDVRCEQSL